MSKRKSKHYNWFNSPNDPEKKKKKWWKRPLKITKIITYTSLFSLSLVGCVQTIVIKSSKNTGAGLEFYKSRNAIAPHVVTLQESNIYGNKSLTGLSPKTNYWLKNQNTLSELHKQNSNVGAWKTKTQTLRIENTDDDSVTGNPIVKIKDNFLVANDNSKYKYKNDSKNPIYAIADKNNNLPNLLLKGATWGNINDIAFPKKHLLTLNTLKTKSNTIDKNFATDAYTYLSNQYLQKWPDTKLSKGDLVSPEWKAWINNYIVISEATGWEDKYVKSKTNSPSNPKGEFGYINKKGQVPFLSFDNMKVQRAIYSWKGAWHLGPFYALFVYPLAFITGRLIGAMPSMAGWEAIFAIMIVVILVRSFAYALSFKSTLQTVKQQEVQSKVAVINAKYEPYKGNKQMDRRKQQEVSNLYKKEGVSALGAFSQIFLTMPLFLSMWRVIGATPSLKSTIWLGINFASTSWRELFKGGWQYLPLMLITAGIQALQAITPRLFSKRREKNRVNIYQKQAMKKTNKTQNIMVAVFVIMSLILPAGLQVYWFFTGLYTIGQNTMNHYIIKYQSKNRKRKTGY